MAFRKRGKVWYYSIELKTSDGKRHRYERPGGLTKAECKEAYLKALSELNITGKHRRPTKITVGEFLAEWMEKEVYPNYKDNTVDAYRNIVNKHLIHAFGGWPLRELSTPMIQDWFTSLKDQYARSTLKSIYAVLRNALGWAVANRKYLAANPCSGVRLPRCETPPKKAHVFSDEEIKVIFEKFPLGHRFHVPLTIAYYTGMRIGEILALQWQDIDMFNRYISIHTTLYDKKGEYKLEATPKTSSSTRRIPFGQSLFKKFKEFQHWQQKNKFQYGQWYVSSNFVCTRENGTPMTADDIRYFNQWCKKFCGGSLHSFRHTHATRLLESGIGIDYVSKRLGHSTVRTTIDTYETITQKMDNDAVERMEKAL